MIGSRFAVLWQCLLEASRWLLKDKADSEIVQSGKRRSMGTMGSSREAAAPVSDMGPCSYGGLRGGGVCESDSANYAGHTPAQVDNSTRPGWST